MNNTAQERTSQSLQRWEPSAWLDHESASAFGAPWNAPWTWVFGTSAAIPIQPDHWVHTIPPSGASRTTGLKSCCEKRSWHCLLRTAPSCYRTGLAWSGPAAVLPLFSLLLILATLLSWSIRPPAPDTRGSSHLLFALAEIPPLFIALVRLATCLLERSPDSSACCLLLPALFPVGNSLKCVPDARCLVT